MMAKYKNIIILTVFLIAFGSLAIYDHHRVINDFGRLKAFLNNARYSSLFDGKEMIVRFQGKQAELCDRNGVTLQALPVQTLFQVNYDTSIGKDMIVFTPRGTSQYNMRIHGGDIRLRSWLGFEKNIAVNCNGFVGEGVYPGGHNALRGLERPEMIITSRVNPAFVKIILQVNVFFSSRCLDSASGFATDPHLNETPSNHALPELGEPKTPTALSGRVSR